MKKTDIVLLILLFILIAVAIPVIIDWGIIGNNVPSNITNSDWVGFFGGYLGSIVGTGFSLFGIIWTIRFTSKQNQKDREAQVRPFCVVRYARDNKIESTSNMLAELFIFFQPSESEESPYQAALYIRNVGLGPAIDFSYEIDEPDDGREHSIQIVNRYLSTKYYTTNVLQPGAESAIPIHLYFNFIQITQDDTIPINDERSICKFNIKPEIAKKYKNFSLNFRFKYRDLYGNTFFQTAKLDAGMYYEMHDDGTARPLCELQLSETSIPRRI